MVARKQPGGPSGEDKDEDKGAGTASGSGRSAGASRAAEEHADETHALALHVQDLQAENEDLRRRLDGLTESVGAALGFDQIGRGLSSIVSELEPLRYLMPPRNGRPLPRRTIEALFRLRASLERHEWTDVGSLGIVEPDVGFIGQARPDRDKNAL
ncbi:hypothetical protein [Sinomonas halotolerans]|uniref:Uncharacterized protein n=1 Tax=Sinomonas halotolerans TaxID=1644133 RepID=A0ABU9WYJ0_9MICC